MDFSIIIPTRNEERNIGRCLTSLHDLHYPDGSFEVIVVDNGSRDRTVEITSHYGALVVRLPDVTVSALRNKGADIASGKVLAFLDADCIVDADWLIRASLYLDRNDVAGFGSPPRIPEPSTWVQRAWYRIRGRKASGDIHWLESMNLFVRRDLFLEVGGFDEKLATCEDYDFSIRLKSKGRLLCDHRIGAVHHGEACTLRHFFRKETWRGTGNLRGWRSHGRTVQELPSLLLPAAHCLFICLFMLLLVIAWVEQKGFWAFAAMCFLGVWQCPIAAYAFWKNRGDLAGGFGSGTPVGPEPETGVLMTEMRRGKATGYLVGAAQLYLLLNVYCTARGSALFQNIRGIR